MVDIPDNTFINWDADDIQDIVFEILGQVNDTLAAKNSPIYFGIVPSQKLGMEICHFEKGKE